MGRDPTPAAIAAAAEMDGRDRGGDLTIGDGDYCSRCPEADALDCMATDYCWRRDLARAVDQRFRITPRG